MLTLVGLGIWDENDLSLKGLEAIKKADIAYVELYTNLWHGDLKKLEKLVNRTIVVVARKDVEDGFAKILGEAKIKNVCLLVAGDPLSATTHTDLIVQARKINIETKIIHASSICTAVAVFGLQLYKFGKTATMPLPEKKGNVLPA
ncbi:MAG: diphthine synthase, partial [Candidatus Aenigmarchaeota archaeon]|nr:diphthine synthase [Candidatus Aenigmarchaeota archaeon]